MKTLRTEREATSVLAACGVALGLLGAGVAYFAHRNLTYDRAAEAVIRRAGFVEKRAVLPGGSIINYGEGPNSGPPLMLIHGQQTTWRDYSAVLGELSQRYRVFAVDCYGHGGSSKTPADYTAVKNAVDFMWFIEHVVKSPVLISGHSSGGLLATIVAARAPQLVTGLLIEDAPFFATEPGRAEKTFAWLAFRDMHRFLCSGERNFTRYSVEHTYLAHVIGRKGFDALVKRPALDYMRRHPGRIPRLWYLPPGLHVNEFFDLTANLQDGTGSYDLRFGETFYDFSWFAGFDQAQTLRAVRCPSVLLHAAHPPNMRGYYDDRGVLLGAMDDRDASRVHSLLRRNALIDNIKSGHDIHAERPEVFIRAVDALRPSCDGSGS